jgi:hypothetical protein
MIELAEQVGMIEPGALLPTGVIVGSAVIEKVSQVDWERELKRVGLPEYLTRHLVTMAELNRAGRYDRMADGMERVTRRPAISVREFVSLHADEFGGRRDGFKAIYFFHLTYSHVGIYLFHGSGSNNLRCFQRHRRTPPAADCGFARPGGRARCD